MLLFGLVLIGISYLISYSLVPIISNMFVNADFVRPNFRGELIPLGVGLVFPISLLISGTAWVFLQPIHTKMLLLFLMVISSMTLLGLIDDVFGSRNASGLKGHFKKLILEGELTTGALKAIGGGLISLFVSIVIVEPDSYIDIFYVVLNTLIIALSTNSINLLDLRPGRAVKGYLVSAVLLILIGHNYSEIWLLGILTAAVLAYLPYDLKAKTMMGDTGSNVLGISVGLIAALTLPMAIKLTYFIFLVLFHIYTEKYSLTKTIEKNRVLNYLDMIGRK